MLVDLRTKHLTSNHHKNTDKMTEEQINKALNLIDNYQLADAFEFLDKVGFKNSSYAKIKKSFNSKHSKCRFYR